MDNSLRIGQAKKRALLELLGDEDATVYQTVRERILAEGEQAAVQQMLRLAFTYSHQALMVQKCISQQQIITELVHEIG